MKQQSNILPHIRLQFNIDHPRLEECWLDGYECAQHDAEEDANPYETNTLEHEQWADGWSAGFYNETPIYQGIESITRPSTKDQAIMELTQIPATNEARWDKAEILQWTGRVLKVAGAVAATVAAVELLDMAI